MMSENLSKNNGGNAGAVNNPPCGGGSSPDQLIIGRRGHRRSTAAPTTCPRCAEFGFAGMLVEAYDGDIYCLVCGRTVFRANPPSKTAKLDLYDQGVFKRMRAAGYNFREIGEAFEKSQQWAQARWKEIAAGA